MKYFEVYLVLINGITFIIFGWDKKQAKSKNSRVSEFSLLMISFLGGSFGGLFAMIFFRHKTKKWSFLLKFIAILLVQIVACLVILQH